MTKLSQNDDVLKVQLEDVWPVMQEQINAGGSVRFGPKGTSMLPMLRQGIDSVVIENTPEKLNKYDLPLYRRENGQFVLHRVVGVKKSGYVMRGDNQYINEYDVLHSQILAIVTGFYRGDEFVSIDNRKYIKYVKSHVFKRNSKILYMRARALAKRIIKKILRMK